ncbi:MAG: DEAD/DEAH box helicase [Spirochaetes bacterium]|nr:MAG: DEAD/DEAH box helicase [Spirochaetota bacterium]
MKFTELNLHESLQRGIDDVGFTDCTPVQEMTFVKTLPGTDVYVQSQTGTGKTAAFLITIFQMFLTGRYPRNKALVVVPTRELAIQVEEEAKVLGRHTSFKCGSFFGGMGYDKQERLLNAGDLNLYVGTPGRLIDFTKSGMLDLKQFSILVIDEADRMFDMGFIPDIRYIIKKMVPPTERLTMLYSATLSSRVKQLAWEYMNDPFEIEIRPEQLTVDTITQELYHVSTEEKFRLLLGILKKEAPKSGLIFTNTKKMAEIISRRLTANGIENDYISGDLPQKKRLKIIDEMKAGKQELLVATDVAARGLHIEELDMVINYDLPDDCQNYVHRIGRTARAGKSGRAVSLACERYVYNLEAIETFIGSKIPTVWEFDHLLAEDASRELRHDHRSADQRPRGRSSQGRSGQGRSSQGRSSQSRSSLERPSQRRSSQSRSSHEYVPQDRVSFENRDREKIEGAEQPAVPVAVSAESGDRSSKRKRRRKKRGKGGEGAQGQQAVAATQQERPDRSERHDRKKRPDDRRDRKPRTEEKPAKSTSADERLEYYRQKYGDNFSYKKGAEPSSGKAGKKGGVLSKIKSLFKK